MSEKVTFGELVESIAEETEHSKQFTHDFLKDFVDVINGGLEEDGKVNIAGFGKFELQRVDEREGYNPQTEEKITIPAHNKVVFKPYKDLRELVNAPYAHMEPQLIEEEDTETLDTSTDQQATDSQTEDTRVESDSSPDEETEQLKQKQSDPGGNESSREQELNEDDFIPTAPPTSHEQDQDETEDEGQAETDQEPPFDLGEQQGSDENITEVPTSESSEDDGDNGDIVEFNATQLDAEDDLLDTFIGSEEKKEQHDEPSDDVTDTEEAELESEKSDPDETDDKPDEITSHEIEEDDTKKETTQAEEEVLAEEVEKLEEAAEDLKQDQPDRSDQEDEKTPLPTAATSRSSGRGSSFPYVAAAAIILLLIAAGAWYYSTLPTNDTPIISSSAEPTTPADAANQQSNNNQQRTADQQGADDTQQATQNPSQPAAQSSAKTQSTTNTAPKNQAVEIEEGQTLWSLAEERYGNPRLWPWIYDNNGSLDDPDLIYAGSSLSVPLPSGPQNTLTSTDSMGVAKGYVATYQWYKSNEEPKAKNHLWAAKLYHDDLQQLADVPIDKTDLSYANRAR
jgi:DNA-binding protein HU-beta